MKKPDSQRQKVYRSEHGMEKFRSNLGLKLLGNGVDRIPTTKECQQYIKKVSTYKWFTTRWYIYHSRHTPSVPHVNDGRGRRRPCWDKSCYTIKLPIRTRNEITILHEMAHWIVDMALISTWGSFNNFLFEKTQYDKDHAAHGKEFTSVLLELVRMQLGAEAAKALKSAYKVNKVKCGPRPRLIHRQKVKSAQVLHA